VELLSYAVMAIAGYLLGSIPTGFLVAQSRGIDIRTVGSGNIGATNVSRALGKAAGIAVFFADALKGWTAVVLLPLMLFLIFGLSPDRTTCEVYAIIGGVSALLGHNYTCWLQFKGGKGVATSAGVLVALVPWALLIILIAWILIFAFTRYVSLASIAAAAMLPFATLLTGESVIKVLVTAAMAILAIYRHRENIQRLIGGREPRFTPKPKETAK
jgi:glycerol-3-phosphate acyltransferase PlsY